MMKKRTAALVLTILMSILLFSIDASAASTSRLGGNDRFDVAINVSKKRMVKCLYCRFG